MAFLFGEGAGGVEEFTVGFGDVDGVDEVAGGGEEADFGVDAEAEFLVGAGGVVVHEFEGGDGLRHAVDVVEHTRLIECVGHGGSLEALDVVYEGVVVLAQQVSKLLVLLSDEVVSLLALDAVVVLAELLAPVFEVDAPVVQGRVRCEAIKDFGECGWGWLRDVREEVLDEVGCAG
jgi:hypothetical protein